jgi:hypothetical protein
MSSGASRCGPRLCEGLLRRSHPGAAGNRGRRSALRSPDGFPPRWLAVAMTCGIAPPTVNAIKLSFVLWKIRMCEGLTSVKQNSASAYVEQRLQGRGGGGALWALAFARVTQSCLAWRPSGDETKPEIEDSEIRDFGPFLLVTLEKAQNRQRNPRIHLTKLDKSWRKLDGS